MDFLRIILAAIRASREEVRDAALLAREGGLA